MKWLLIGYIVLQSLDMASTAVKIHQGCVEAFWPNAPTMYAAKSGTIGFVIAWGGKHPTGAAIIEGAGIASGAYGTLHNLRTVCH